MATYRRVVQSRSIRAWSTLSSSSSTSFLKNVGGTQISQLAKPNSNRVFLVDTLALVKRLEGQGVPSRQAEAITVVLNDSLQNVTHSFVSKAEMQKGEIIQEANIWKFKSEVQEHHFSVLQRETEKLRGDIGKMHSELRVELKSVKCELRAQLKATKYDLSAQLEAAKYDLSAQLEAAKYDLSAQLEAAKYDVIKYCIGTLVSISAVGLAGLAVIRILL